MNKNLCILSLLIVAIISSADFAKIALDSASVTKIQNIASSTTKIVLERPRPQIRGVSLASKTSNLDSWLISLSKLENCSPKGTMDADHTLSFGKFCYKLSTFKNYSMKYGISGKISDPLTQYRLTYKIAEDEPTSIVKGLWWTSIVRRGLGLPPKPEVAMIP